MKRKQLIQNITISIIIGIILGSITEFALILDISWLIKITQSLMFWGIVMCICVLISKNYSLSLINSMDNSIIVLKSNDYEQMKRDALTGKRAYSSVVTIGDEYIKQGYVYLKYSLEDDTHSDTGYNFPFAIKAYITDDTEIIGNLQREKNVKVQYENSNVPLDELKIKSIEVIEN